MINLLNLGNVTSKFGKRKAPTAGASTDHKGIDIVLSNPNIPAVLGGTVSAVSYSATAGNNIAIQAEDGTLHQYLHLKNLPALKVGDKIKEGQTIGVMGSTGVSTGAHLDFRVKKDGQYINPETYMVIYGDSNKVTQVKPEDIMPAPNDVVKGVLGGLLPDGSAILHTVIKTVIIVICLGFAALLLNKSLSKNGGSENGNS